jgi:hypothetical protein
MLALRVLPCSRSHASAHAALLCLNVGSPRWVHGERCKPRKHSGCNRGSTDVLTVGDQAFASADLRRFMLMWLGFSTAFVQS